jgi:hypothetical protein
MSYSTGYAERHKHGHHHPQSSYQNGQNYQNNRQPYHRPHTTLGAAGHWVHLLNVAAPLVISEVVKDADKKWRYLRLASVGGALVSEAAWTLKVAHDRRREEEDHAALEQCQDRCR